MTRSAASPGRQPVDAHAEHLSDAGGELERQIRDAALVPRDRDLLQLIDAIGELALRETSRLARRAQARGRPLGGLGEPAASDGHPRSLRPSQEKSR